MQEEKLQNTPSTGGRRQYVVIACVLLLLAVPLVFLFRKQSSKPSEPLPAKIDIAALERAASADPSYNNLISLSVGYINTGNPGNAIAPLQQALTLKPQSAVAYNNLGVVYTMLKNFPMAIDACNKAIAYDTAFNLAKNNLKWALDEQKKVFDNISRMEKIPLNDRDSSFYVELGLQYYYLGNYQKSMDIYQEGLAKEEHNSALLNNIGTNLVMMKRYDEAIAKFSKVLAIDTSNQLARNNIVWAKSEQARELSALNKK